MTNFLYDTKEIDNKINIKMPEVAETPLIATFLPYYVDPESLKLTVLLMRSILPGSHFRTGRNMGLTCLSIELPEGEDITIEEAFKSLEIPATLQNAIPFGSVMKSPEMTSDATEMVLAHIDPPELVDETRGIVYQKTGKFEVGIVEFDLILEAIQDNFIQDMTTRLMLSELYIMAVEEANNQEENQLSNFDAAPKGEGMIGSGIENFPKGAQDMLDKETPKTSTISDEVIEQNSQMDFGAIYSRK